MYQKVSRFNHKHIGVDKAGVTVSSCYDNVYE